MQSLKIIGGIFSNVTRFSTRRSICLSNRSLVESDWTKSSSNSDDAQEEDESPVSVTSGGIEKSKNAYCELHFACFNKTSYFTAINSVTLLGRVGSNPVKRGSVEHPVVTFSLATNSNYSYANGVFLLST